MIDSPQPQQKQQQPQSSKEKLSADFLWHFDSQIGEAAGDFEDEKKLEKIFLRQASQAASRAVADLMSINYPVNRPSDYYAEMYKSDEHMQRMRKQITSKQKELARQEKLENLKLLRAYAKKIKESNVAKQKKESKSKNVKKASLSEFSQKHDANRKSYINKSRKDTKKKSFKVTKNNKPTPRAKQSKKKGGGKRR